MNRIGYKIIHEDVTESTNLQLKKLAKEGASEGLVYKASYQTSGRGRNGKLFYSPSGGLYFSILLKPDCDLKKVNFITLLTAVCVVKTIKELYKIEAGIKWVNDILYDDKKLCGILTESVISTDSYNSAFVIVGVGINLNTYDFPPEIKDIATSLYRILKRNIDEKEFLETFLNIFNEYYIKFKSSIDLSFIIDEYKSHLSIIGKDILVIRPDKKFKAKAVSLSDNGGLIIKDENGKLSELISGEISTSIKRD